MVCKLNLLHNSSACYANCPSGSFSLPGMTTCHPWLDCDAQITIVSLISISIVKTVFLADWNGYNVVLSVLSSERYEEDFEHNLSMIQLHSPHKLVVQLLGYCENSILTEYHELGSALNIQYHLNTSLKAYDNLKTRLNLCISYVSIIELLHNTPSERERGARVMCDSNSIEKTLSQYLLASDLNLVVNDLDATPKVDFLKGGVHCGSKELKGEFIAPEQLWPYPGKVFDENEMPFYDEKTDIFKIPDVCNFFLGNDPAIDIVKYNLFNVHKNCKIPYSNKRPTAGVIIDVYKKVLNDLE